VFFTLKSKTRTLDPDQNADPDPRNSKNADPDSGTPKVRICIRNPALKLPKKEMITLTCISDDSVLVWNENVGPAGGRGRQGQPAHLFGAVPTPPGGGTATQHNLRITKEQKLMQLKQLSNIKIQIY